MVFISPIRRRKNLREVLWSAVGPGKVTDDGKRQPVDVKVGDTILFDKYSGSKIRIDDEDYLIIREEDILGIVE